MSHLFRLDSIESEEGPMSGCCKQGNQPLVSIKRLEICWRTTQLSSSLESPCLMESVFLYFQNNTGIIQCDGMELKYKSPQSVI
jgi:hypothetical protein